MSKLPPPVLFQIASRTPPDVDAAVKAAVLKRTWCATGGASGPFG